MARFVTPDASASDWLPAAPVMTKLAAFPKFVSMAQVFPLPRFGSGSDKMRPVTGASPIFETVTVNPAVCPGPTVPWSAVFATVTSGQLLKFTAPIVKSLRVAVNDDDDRVSA